MMGEEKKRYLPGIGFHLVVRKLVRNPSVNVVTGHKGSLGGMQGKGNRHRHRARCSPIDKGKEIKPRRENDANVRGLQLALRATMHCSLIEIMRGHTIIGLVVVVKRWPDDRLIIQVDRGSGGRGGLVEIHLSPARIRLRHSGNRHRGRTG